MASFSGYSFMKIYPSLLLGALLIAAGCTTSPVNPHPAALGDITVNFKDPDKFSDARDSFSGQASQYYLDVLGKYLKEVASQRLNAGQKLEVTFTDIDLAGDIIPGQTTDIRVIKPIYIPRMDLTFTLRDAGGAVIKEGVRHLTDLNFQDNILPINQNEPLRYDKPLLANWVKQEFTP
jgi:Protein of unknown function (DUF3016)